MKMWPKTREGWIKGTLSVLCLCLLLFTVSSIAASRVSECGWERRDYVTDRTYSVLSGHLGMCSFWTVCLLGLFLMAAAAAGYWRSVRWGLVWLGAWFLLCFLMLPVFARAREKPVIYLYPSVEQAVNVKLSYGGKLLHAYPEYDSDGWQVIAKPSGELVNTRTGRSHYCLFWEGVDSHEYALTEGFVVAGKDTAAFLESTLTTLGLSEREANEFIIYWLPRMENNAFNVIGFPSEEYSQQARLEIAPAPDTVIRVFMVFKPVAKRIGIAPATLKPITRRGFTVVEWGGTELD